MKKILKQGLSKEAVDIFTVTCSHCGCEFEFGDTDWENYKFDTIDDLIKKNESIRVICPYCNSLIIKNPASISIRQEVRQVKTTKPPKPLPPNRIIKKLWGE